MISKTEVKKFSNYFGPFKVSCICIPNTEQDPGNSNQYGSGFLNAKKIQTRMDPDPNLKHCCNIADRLKSYVFTSGPIPAFYFIYSDSNWILLSIKVYTVEDQEITQACM